jgi:galactoside O-acetyltransferase
MERLVIGDSVRIDGYTTIIAMGRADVSLGSYIHIGAYCHLSGSFGIEMHDFSGVSQGVKLYSTTDDYSGKCMTNAMVPTKFRGGSKGSVVLCRHVVVGAGSVILPNVRIGEGSSVGALSLVTKSLEEWGVYFGSPVRRLKTRSKKLIELEKEFLAESNR